MRRGDFYIMGLTMLVVLIGLVGAVSGANDYAGPTYRVHGATVFLEPNQALPSCEFMEKHGLGNVQPTDGYELDLYEMGCVD